MYLIETFWRGEEPGQKKSESYCHEHFKEAVDRAYQMITVSNYFDIRMTGAEVGASCIQCLRLKRGQQLESTLRSHGFINIIDPENSYIEAGIVSDEEAYNYIGEQRHKAGLHEKCQRVYKLDQVTIKVGLDFSSKFSQIWDVWFTVDEEEFPVLAEKIKNLVGVSEFIMETVLIGPTSMSGPDESCENHIFDAYADRVQGEVMVSKDGEGKALIKFKNISNSGEIRYSSTDT